MRSPIGWSRHVGGDNLVTRHIVGNAAVLHTDDNISPEAQALALAVHHDDENDVVVLDLHGGMPVGIWESVAGAVTRRRRGIRLVVCGQRQETATLAGQWLSDRLGRSVLAPYGYLVRGSSGLLFVHDGPGSGWVRYRPGKPPAWDAKRFPRPLWDRAAADLVMTSSACLAEPLPGGVWIRDTNDAGNLHNRWQWLVSSLPCLQEELPIVLGCPGTPPLPLDDIARFWRGLDDDSRARARFVHYGPVQMPRGEALGQVLADLLGTPIVCFAGIPVGAPDTPDMYTVTTDGSLGWRAFARELAYVPRSGAGEPARTPRVVDHRAPDMLGEPIAPLTYWYANDAVIEVVQSGLWVRSAEVPRGAEQVRATMANAEHHTLIFDDSTAARGSRMRALAEDIIARLDAPTRARSALLPASVAIAEAGKANVAGGRYQAPSEMPVYEATVIAPAADSRQYATEAFPQLLYAPGSAVEGEVTSATAAALMPVSVPELAQAPAEPTGSAGERAVSVSPTALPSTGNPSAGRAAGAWPPPDAVPAVQSPWAPATGGGTAQGAPAGTPGAPLEPAFGGGGPVAWVEPQIEAGPAVDVEPAPEAKPAIEFGHTVGFPPVDDRPVAVAPARDSPTPADGPLRRSSASVDESAGPMAFEPPVETVGPPIGESPTAVTPSAPYDSAEPGRLTVRVVPKARLQPTPQPAASAILRGKSLEDERTWLRRTLSRDFDSVASAISRILSEQPGLQGVDARDAADILVDSVAVRLYLTPQGKAIDDELRHAAKGPHVPFARCVAAGLGRLPSHRGATIIPASPEPAAWDLLRGERLLTEWGFLGALTSPSPNLAGDTDVLIWSMTARRTRLLEPDGDQRATDRVLFLPGTSFKVLDVATPGNGTRGRVLVRELTADEIDAEGRVRSDRVSYDELAVRSLERYAESCAEAVLTARVGAASVDRFGSLPGMV